MLIFVIVIIRFSNRDGKWISRKKGFSLNDLLQINRMYNCPSKFKLNTLKFNAFK